MSNEGVFACVRARACALTDAAAHTDTEEEKAHSCGGEQACKSLLAVCNRHSHQEQHNTTHTHGGRASAPLATASSPCNRLEWKPLLICCWGRDATLLLLTSFSDACVCACVGTSMMGGQCAYVLQAVILHHGAAGRWEWGREERGGSPAPCSHTQLNTKHTPLPTQSRAPEQLADELLAMPLPAAMALRARRRASLGPIISRLRLNATRGVLFTASSAPAPPHRLLLFLME